MDKALGFKVMLSHVEEYHPLQSIIANENYKIIKLSRKNILKSSLSSILMKKRNVAHSVENIEARKVHVDPESLVKQLKKQEKDTLKLNSLFPSNQTMNITYEELFADNDYLFRNILSFIEVSSDNIKKPALKKISPAEIKDIISNYDEVRKVLENRGYEEYLI